MKDNAIQEFVDAIKEPHVETDKTYSATVSHIDEEGRVWVYLAGSTIETPTESTSSEVKRGDVVTVEWRNNKLYIAGNYSNPSAGLTRIIYVEQKTNEAIDEAKQAVKNVGIAIEKSIEAMKIAGDTDQHYWFTETGTDTGAHITEVTQEEWNDPTSENYHSGGNLLARSNGMAVRNGLTELAKFGASNITVGVDDGTQSYLYENYHSLKMFDKEGNTYLHVSDLRGTDNKHYIEEHFQGNNEDDIFYLSCAAVCVLTDDTVPTAPKCYYTKNQDDSYRLVSSTSGKNPKQEGWYEPVYSVTFSYDDDEQHTDPTIRAKYIDHVRLYDDMENGITMMVSYYTQSNLAKAYTFGIRSEDSDIGAMSFAEGLDVISSSRCTHAEGRQSTASGTYSHAEGFGTNALGNYGSHAEGYMTTASGERSHSEGCWPIASGDSSHAEGYGTTASGKHSHAEGGGLLRADGPIASGSYSHAEGSKTTASGTYSHAEGFGTNASDRASHAEGSKTTASGDCSHAQNKGTIAAKNNQTVIGKYNIEDTASSEADQKALIIGNGTSNRVRSNALTVDWSGNVLTSGGVNARGTVETGTNIDYVTTVGTYYLNGNNTYTNAPASFGILEVIAYDTTASILMQRVTQNSLQWTRRRTASNTWTTWQLTNTYGIISEDVLLADNVTVNASSYANSSLSVAKTGYTPIGVVGYHLQNASSNGANNTLCAMHSCYLSGSSCAWIVRNTGGSNAKIKITATILYTIS